MGNKTLEGTDKATDLQAATTTKTAKEIAIAQDALDKTKNETQRNLNDLKTTIDNVQAGQDGKKIFTEALNSNTNYKKQVEQILGMQSGEGRDSPLIIADIKTLQKALNVKDDGALGPNTFNALKKAWNTSQFKEPKPNYKTFIDGLMGRKTEVQTNLNLQTDTITGTNSTLTEVIESDPTKDLKLDEHNNKIMLGNDSYDFELEGNWKTLGIDRDAYKIMDNQSSYDLNIRGKEDNIRISKEDLFRAIKSRGGEVEGTTLPKKGGVGEPVKIIINEKKGASIVHEGKPERSNTNTASLDSNDGTSLNISIGNMQVNKDGVIVPSESNSSGMNFSNITPQNMQIDRTNAAKLEAQIAIQPVIETLQNNVAS